MPAAKKKIVKKKPRKPGPKPTPTAVLAARGGWRGKKRIKDEAMAGRKKIGWQKRPKTVIPDLDAICRTGIPGYDPWRDTGGAEFVEAAALHAVAFFHEQLSHVKGSRARQPFILERFQAAIVGNLFGWINPDGLRRYRESLIYLPRRNGKTTLAAGLVLFMLFEDDEFGAEVYGAASEYKQASLLFAQAAGMVKMNPALLSRCKVYDGQAKSIQLHDEEGSGTYRVISSKDDAAHGFNVHCAVIDELHVQPDDRLVETLQTGTGSRDQPMIIAITTADHMRESVCNRKYDHACRVRDGILDDPRFLPVLYECPLDTDWKTPEAYLIANPNLGVSVKEDYLDRELERALGSTAYEAHYRRLHLCQRTETDVVWLDMVKWDQCSTPLDLDALKGQRCFAGLDVAATVDTTALVLYFPDCGAVLPFVWIPEDTAREKERVDRVPYRAWQKDGYIEFTPGNACDQGFIRKKINELAELYEIVSLGVDDYNAGKLLIELEGDGVRVFKFRQNFSSMTAPTKELEKLVLGCKIHHGGHPVLRWQASNVVVSIDALENLRPDKKKSAQKIDAIVSLIMAIGRAQCEEKATGSAYDDHGVITVG